MIAEIDEFVSDGADWTSTGRLFQSRGPAVANERSPTVQVATGGRRGDWRSTRNNLAEIVGNEVKPT